MPLSARSGAAHRRNAHEPWGHTSDTHCPAAAAAALHPALTGPTHALRRRVAAAVGFAGALAIIASGISACTGSPPPTPSASTRTSTASTTGTAGGGGAATPTLSQAQADTLATTVTNADPKTAASALVPDLAAGVTKSGSHLLPAGTTLHLNTAAAKTDSSGLVTVPATTTGTLAGTWSVTLVQQNGKWLILSAVPA